MPDNLLIALHQCHPDAKLSVSLRNLDQAILSSSQLHQLSVSIPCSTMVQDETMTALEQVKRVVTGCHSLRKLSIDVHQLPSVKKSTQATRAKSIALYEPVRAETKKRTCRIPGAAPQHTEAYNKLQMILEPMDRFPPLEELALRARRYLLDKDHCIRLRGCMDWSKLKRLVLGPPNPVAFLETFTHELPMLEHLDISFHWNLHLHSYNFENYGHKTYSGFVASLKKLKSIIIRCNAIDLRSEGLWSTLMESHRKSLQSISIQALYEGLEAPILHGSLKAYSTALISLKTLDLALSADSQSWRSCDDCSGRRHLMVRLPTFSWQLTNKRRVQDILGIYHLWHLSTLFQYRSESIRPTRGPCILR
jgi:hypothetical protein